MNAGMQTIWNNLGQVAVIVAFIALVGVILKALSDWLTTSRSKYVDVIAAERIKWVGELRSDVREFSVNLDELSHQCRQEPINKETANEAIERASRHLNLIQLKLNLDDPLDSALFSLMSRTAYFARTKGLQEYADLKGLMILRASYLLKDEWEKAKREASGPIRWLWLSWKQSRRQRKRKKLAASEPMKSLLKMAATPLSPEEKAMLAAQGTK